MDKNIHLPLFWKKTGLCLSLVLIVMKLSPFAFLLISNIMQMSWGSEKRCIPFDLHSWVFWMCLCIYWALQFILLIGWLTKTRDSIEGLENNELHFLGHGKNQRASNYNSEKNMGEDPRAVLTAPRNLGSSLTTSSQPSCRGLTEVQCSSHVHNSFWMRKWHIS